MHERFRHRVEIKSSVVDHSVLKNDLRRGMYNVCTGESLFQKESQGPAGTSPPFLFAYKGRFSPIGNLLFHISFLFLALAVFVSMMFRFEGSAMVTEGYKFSGSPQEYTSLSISPMTSIPDLSFTLKKITPAFWEDRLLFTDLRADLKYKGGEESAWMSSSARVGDVDVTVNGIGLTPMYLLKDRNGRQLDVAYVNLAIFIPGNEDHFKLPGLPHKVFLSFYPDHSIVGNKVVNRSMNPINPAYDVKVLRGRLPVFSGLVKPGEEARFENLRLSFPEFIYWGDFRLVKDPGFIFAWIAFVLFVVGLAWRLLFYRREIALVKEGDSFYLYGRSDYYPHLFESSLKALSEKLKLSRGDCI